MNHSILSTPGNLRNRPADAAGYVLGNESWKKQQRDNPPIILSGSRDGFIRMANLATKGPAYLSIALSDKGTPELSKIRYAVDLYRSHYLAGVSEKDVGELTVLHPKFSGWDVHTLVGLIIRGCPKKGRFLRPVADYLRFAWLTSSIDRLFGWSDPFDPRNYCPIHLKKSWLDKPVSVTLIEEKIATGFHKDQIDNRADIVNIIESLGFSPSLNDQQITVTVEGLLWTFVGYASTSHADYPEKLLAHRQRTTKPFSDVRDHLAEIEHRLLALYAKRAMENAAYYGVPTFEAWPGLIVPNAEYFRTHYENRAKEVKQSSELDRTFNLRISGRHQKSADRYGQHGVRTAGDERSYFRSGKASGGRGKPTDIVGSKRPESEGPNPGSRNAAEINGGGDGEYECRVRKRLHDFKETRRRIEEWTKLIQRIIRTPRWLRQHRSNQKKQTDKLLKRFPDLKRRAIPKRLAAKLPIPITIPFLPEPGQPDTVKPKPVGHPGPIL